jgi:hypothetical protein
MVSGIRSNDELPTICARKKWFDLTLHVLSLENPPELS